VTLDLPDIQGLVVRGYGRMTAARYLVAEIADPAQAGTWLEHVAGQVDSAHGRPEARAVNVAFTSSGLTRLGLEPSALETFAEEFVSGMAAPFRQAPLGDVAESAPERWSWGGPGSSVDLLVLLFARDAGELDAAQADLLALPGAGGIRVVAPLDTSPLEDREHFGFRDGVAQPWIEELGPAPFPDSIKAGEFVLGYPNEYGLLTDVPADVGRNGSYLVFRQLSQDVQAFWDYCEQATLRPDGSVDTDARTRLAAKMVGRWPSGAPLALAPDADDPALATANDFGYHAEDPAGLRCPVGAHVRRSNPRDSLDPDPGSRRSVEVGKRHRLLRRGRKYGPLLTRDELLSAGAPGEWRDDDRGLHFICLVGNIARQFEFVQRTWINSPRFAGLYDAPDPLMSPEPPGGRTFTVPARPVRERYTGLPRFVATRGGAYFFLPGIAALRRIARLPRSLTD
jgi:Dyp-type peroxidase family